MEFLGFFPAILGDWVSLMTGIGSLISLILGFVPHRIFKFFNDYKVQKKIFWGLALFLFFIASISVWTREHNKVNELKEQYDKSKPQLSADIPIVATIPAPKNKANLILALEVRVTNTGSPSIATDFTVSIKIKEKQIDALPILAKQINLTNLTPSGLGLHFESKDYLPKKCFDQPIVTGGGIEGYLIYMIPNVSKDQIKDEGIIILSFKDVTGKTYSINRAWDKEGEERARNIITPDKILK